MGPANGHTDDCPILRLKTLAEQLARAEEKLADITLETFGECHCWHGPSCHNIGKRLKLLRAVCATLNEAAAERRRVNEIAEKPRRTKKRT